MIDHEPYYNVQKKIAEEFGFFLLDTSENPKGYEKDNGFVLVKREEFPPIYICVWRVSPFYKTELPHLWHNLHALSKHGDRRLDFKKMAETRRRNQEALDSDRPTSQRRTTGNFRNKRA